MMKLGFLELIKDFDEVKLIRDEKSVKIASRNTLQNYLQTELWYNLETSTIINDIPKASDSNNNIIFVDWISSIVWSYYENSKRIPFNIIRNKMIIKQLFFNR